MSRVRERNFEFERERPWVQPPKMALGSNQQNYRCVVRIALWNEISNLKGKGDGSNQQIISQGPQPQKEISDNKNILAFPQGGGLERGSPAMTGKPLRQGVKETHNINVVGRTTKPS